jgi:hypothetical protein
MFAPHAYTADELVFGLAAEPRGALPDCAGLMREAADLIRLDPEQVAVLFIETEADASLVTEQQLAADLLQYLHEHDRIPWPAGAPTDPLDPHWVFWFEGIDFFINFSSPGHALRHSRNLGPALTAVVQSRSSFDRFSGPDSKVRSLIRARVDEYDRLPAHPALGSYGDPVNRELFQYFLGDSNDKPIDLLNGCDAGSGAGSAAHGGGAECRADTGAGTGAAGAANRRR